MQTFTFLLREGPRPLHIWEASYAFYTFVGLLGLVISPSQSLYLHRTAQHRRGQTSMS
jgi:hypothetical protein